MSFPLRVLHIGWAYRPLRGGGLIAYADDLMALERERGVQVAYFCAGRLHSGKRKPRLSRWSRDGVAIFEIEDPCLLHAGDAGNFPPELELAEPNSERFFRQVLGEFRPDLVHIHEMAGLPFSLLGIASDEYHLPLAMTLHNYFMFCPTLNLYQPDGTPCLMEAPTLQCPRCCGTVRHFREHLIQKTFQWEGALLARAVHGLLRPVEYLLHAMRRVSGPTPELFRARLEGNLAYLAQIDLLVSQSKRTAQIYRQRTGRDDIHVLHSSLPHIDRLRPRVMIRAPERVRFATLNGCLVPYKGAGIIADALDILMREGFGNRFLLDVWGEVHVSVHKRLASTTAVSLRGRYRQDELDDLLDQVDVGLIPSLCEEVYGYTGIEFLAKGIPLIGNPRGGITDYLFDGSTGWLNRPCSAEGLAGLMKLVIREPSTLLPLNKAIRARRSELIADRAGHADRLIALYQQTLTRKGLPHVAPS